LHRLERRRQVQGAVQNVFKAAVSRRVTALVVVVVGTPEWPATLNLRKDLGEADVECDESARSQSDSTQSEYALATRAVSF